MPAPLPDPYDEKLPPGCVVGGLGVLTAIAGTWLLFALFNLGKNTPAHDFRLYGPPVIMAVVGVAVATLTRARNYGLSIFLTVVITPVLANLLSPLLWLFWGFPGGSR